MIRHKSNIKILEEKLLSIQKIFEDPKNKSESKTLKLDRVTFLRRLLSISQELLKSRKRFLL